MPKYKVSVPYFFTLEGYFEADNEKHALELFDETPTMELREEYQGLLEGTTPETIIEELKE